MGTIAERLNEYEIHPNERLGQHILVDEQILNLIASQISPDANVIEIGAGPGNLTEALTRTAGHVVGIEIDRQYQEILENLQKKINGVPDMDTTQTKHGIEIDTTQTSKYKHHKKSKEKVTIIFGDATKINYRNILMEHRDQKWEVAANIPYHISEPILKILTTLPVSSVILMVGDNFGKTIQTDNPHSDWYTKSSLTANAFYSVENILEIPPKAFYPVPSTRSHLMRLTAFEGEDINPWNRIFRQLVQNERSKPVRSVLETAFSNSNESSSQRSKKERNRFDRRETNRELAKIARSGTYILNEEMQNPHSRVLYSNIGNRLGLPDPILDSQFGSLNNEEIRTLAISVRNYFSR